jgi:hypothetical protein
VSPTINQTCAHETDAQTIGLHIVDECVRDQVGWSMIEKILGSRQFNAPAQSLPTRKKGLTGRGVESHQYGQEQE